MELSADVYNSSSHIYSHHSVPVIGIQEDLSRLGRISMLGSVGTVPVGSGEGTSQARTVRKREPWCTLKWPASKLPMQDQQLTPVLFARIVNLAIHQLRIEIIIWGPQYENKKNDIAFEESENDDQIGAARHALQGFTIIPPHTMKMITPGIAGFKESVLFIFVVLITDGLKAFRRWEVKMTFWGRNHLIFL